MKSQAQIKKEIAANKNEKLTAAIVFYAAVVVVMLVVPSRSEGGTTAQFLSALVPIALITAWRIKLLRVGFKLQKQLKVKSGLPDHDDH